MQLSLTTYVIPFAPEFAPVPHGPRVRKQSAPRGQGSGMQRGLLVELVPSLQPIDLAPFPFGRTSGALVTAPGRRLFQGFGRRREILIEDACHLRGAPALGKS